MIGSLLPSFPAVMRQHPCFDSGAHERTGRVHLPIAPRCNIHCRFCERVICASRCMQHPGWARKLLTPSEAVALVRRLARTHSTEPFVVGVAGPGEPLANAETFEALRQVHQEFPALQKCVSTNGLLLDKAMSRELIELGVDRLVVSLDGVRPETYASVRGAALSGVLQHIRDLNEAKREMGSLSPALGIEFVALRSNVGELADLTGLASRLGATRVLVSNILAYTDEMRSEILYGYEPRRPLDAGSWPVKAGAWVMWGTLDLPRMHWGAERRCRFVQDRATVIGWDGNIAPCYALSHSYSYLAIDGRRKQVARYALGNVTQQSLLDAWTSEDYCRFRSEVRDFRFPSCPDCDLRETCDLRERNEGCWGWNPSCADCLWAQDIVRCP